LPAFYTNTAGLKPGFENKNLALRDAPGDRLPFAHLRDAMKFSPVS
jgi:hypothetical protein